MDDTILSPDALSALLAQAEAREFMRKDEARLTPEEADIRRRFAEALWGPPGEEYLSEIQFSEPTTLVVMAEAYRAAGHFQAAMLMLGVWMSIRHPEYREHVESGLAIAPLPPVPSNWKVYRERVYTAMTLDMPPDDTVSYLRR